MFNIPPAPGWTAPHTAPFCAAAGPPLLPAGAAGGRLLQEALALSSGRFSGMGSRSAAGCEHGGEGRGRGAIDLVAIGRVGGLDALHEAVLTVPVRLVVVRVGSPAAWGGFPAVTAGREHRVGGGLH